MPLSSVDTYTANDPATLDTAASTTGTGTGTGLGTASSLVSAGGGGHGAQRYRNRQRRAPCTGINTDTDTRPRTVQFAPFVTFAGTLSDESKTASASASASGSAAAAETDASSTAPGTRVKQFRLVRETLCDLQDGRAYRAGEKTKRRARKEQSSIAGSVRAMALLEKYGLDNKLLQTAMGVESDSDDEDSASASGITASTADAATGQTGASGVSDPASSTFTARATSDIHDGTDGTKTCMSTRTRTHMTQAEAQNLWLKSAGQVFQTNETARSELLEAMDLIKQHGLFMFYKSEAASVSTGRARTDCSNGTEASSRRRGKGSGSGRSSSARKGKKRRRRQRSGQISGDWSESGIDGSGNDSTGITTTHA